MVACGLAMRCPAAASARRILRGVALLFLATAGFCQIVVVPSASPREEQFSHVQARPQGGYVATVSKILTQAAFLPIGRIGSWVDVSSTSGLLLGGSGLDLTLLRLDAEGREIARLMLVEGGASQTVGMVQLRDGSVVVAGNTNAASFPRIQPLFPDVTIPAPPDPPAVGSTRSWGFILKTDPGMTRVERATLIGGAAGGDGPGTRIWDLARDSQGNLYLTGTTSQPDFPVSQTAWKRDSGLANPRKGSEGFVMKLSGDLRSLLGSTFLGADTLPCGAGLGCSDGELRSNGYRLTIGSRGEQVLLLGTNGQDFPVTGADNPEPPASYPWANAVRHRVYLCWLTSDLSTLRSSAFVDFELPFFSSFTTAGRALQTLSDGTLLVALRASGAAPEWSIDIDFATIDRLFRWSADGSRLLEKRAFGGPEQLVVSDVAAGGDGTLWISGTAGRAVSTVAGMEPVIDTGGTYSKVLLRLRENGLTLLRADRLPLGAPMQVAEASPGGLSVFDGYGYIERIPAEGIAEPAILGLSLFTDEAMRSTRAVSPLAFGRLIGIGFAGTATEATFDRNGYLPTVLAGFSFTIDGTPAPLLRVTPQTVDFIAPGALAAKAGQTVTGELTGPGGLRLTIPLRVLARQLNAFRGAFDEEQGRGLAVALNPNGTLNSRENPARPGDVVAFYLNGAGSPVTALDDGKRVDAAMPWLDAPALFTLSLPTPEGNSPPPRAAITYFGAAPGLVAGTIQMNVRVPAWTVLDGPLSGGGATVVHSPRLVQGWIQLPERLEDGNLLYGQREYVEFWVGETQR